MKNPLETVGDGAPGLGCVKLALFLAAGTRTSRSALAPQLSRLANGLLLTLEGLPLLPSPSSIALSSAAEAVDDMEDTEPLLNPEMFVCILGGEPPDILMRRLLLACAAAVVIGPGYAVVTDGWRLDEKKSVRVEPGENEALR